LAGGRSISDLTQRTHYLRAMTRTETQNYEQASRLIATTQARRAELATVDSRLDDLVAQAADAQADLDAQFVQAAEAHRNLSDELAEAEAARLAAEAEAARQAAAAEQAREVAAANAEERRAAAASRSAASAPPPSAPAPAAPAAAPVSAPAPSVGGKVCPQDQPRSFTDTWGAPRSGGRTHEGTDIFGARGGNVFAIVDGTVDWLTVGETSGLMLSLSGDDGNTYWYMHLQDFVASEGQRVSAGEIIAHNGDTGNAQGTSPHIHFEYHPGGGGPINPYPLLKEVCG
jgi:murein DD-endopeptidase MepM/ murein hydrolase activator NlpD